MRGALKALLLCLCVVVAPAGRATSIGDTAPDWTLPGVAGTTVSYYADARANASVVVFWATWCPYCRRLMPHLQVLADEFRARGVKFYALDVWDDGDPVAYMKRHGYTFELLLNADDVADAYGVRATPGLFAIDATRRVVYKRFSGDSDAEVERDLREALRRALQGPAAAD